MAKLLVRKNVVTPIPKTSKVADTSASIRVTESPYDDELEGDYEVTVKKNQSSFRFGFNCAAVEFCCGIKELGNFRIYNGSTSTVITKEEKIKAVVKLLETLDSKCDEDNGVITTMFTLINNAPCDLVRDAIKMVHTHQIVKEFRNSNSGNNNVLYVSVN